MQFETTDASWHGPWRHWSTRGGTSDIDADLFVRNDKQPRRAPWLLCSQQNGHTEQRVNHSALVWDLVVAALERQVESVK
jgi:hypothetical protein